MLNLKPIYFPSEVNVAKNLFAPISSVSNSIDCMVGYFTSGSLSELAGPLVSYFHAKPNSVLRMIVSPNLSLDDVRAIKEAVNTQVDMLPILFTGFELTEDSLKSKTLQALSYLIATKRLDIRIALLDEALFHTKSWIFDTKYGPVAVSGSGNATKSGLSKNFEQFIVSQSWVDDSSREICSDLKSRFDSIWSGEYPGIVSVKLSTGTLNKLEEALILLQKNDPELIKNIANTLNNAFEVDSIDFISSTFGHELKVPEWLQLRDGAYKHQGNAIDAWVKNGFFGIMSIATGGGKTLTSLAAAKLLSETYKSLIIIVAVPTKPLLDQWEEEVKQFGVKPVNTIELTGKQITFEVKQSLRQVRSAERMCKVIIVTHAALSKDALDVLSTRTKGVKTLLIADEVHNIGASTFSKKSPNYYDFKIGLSATPTRQFDDEGSSFLMNYFGGIVFEFGLKEAIGNCLVPFDYFAHRVYLTAEEEMDLIQLTQEIKKLSYAINLPEGDPLKERYSRLCLSRRRLIESAELKIRVLERIFPIDREDVKKSIIFATDKFPEQLDKINVMLNTRRVNFHQVTGEETANRRLLREIVSSFSNGSIQVLTSKRVLDEGFNVPQTEVAYLVAANTVVKQWTQRLGRVLRLSPNTGKTHAVIHDFVVIPNSEGMAMDEDLKTTVRSELSRVMFFGSLCQNGSSPKGYINMATELLGVIEK